MPLFLITGLPGSGKSTVCAELKSRGYEAYDGDEDGLAKWHNDKTGLAVSKESEERTPEFIKSHSRNISRETVEALALRAKDKLIFLCNDPENEKELQDLFSEVFALVVDEDVRQHRLASRTNNNWGKLRHEREYDLRFRRQAQSVYKKFGYVTLDATQSTKNIVDQILQRAGA